MSRQGLSIPVGYCPFVSGIFPCLVTFSGSRPSEPRLAVAHPSTGQEFRSVCLCTVSAGFLFGGRRRRRL